MSERPTRIEEVLASPELRRAYAWVLGVVVAITVLKGFRLPNLYAATHFVFNYSCGFVRRGLLGEVMQRVFGERAFTYATFTTFAFVLMGLALWVLVWCVRRVLAAAPADALFRCVLLVFVSSPGVVFFVHIVGYLDYVGLIALLGTLAWAPQSRSKFALFYVVAVCGALFAFLHEILAVMFMPAFAFVMLCHVFRHWPNQSSLGRISMFAHAGAALATAFVLSGVVGTVGTQDVATIAELNAKLAAKVDFRLRADAFEALSRSSAENLSTLMPNYWRHSPWARVAPMTWLAVLPSLLFMFRYGVQVIRDLPLAAWSRWLLGLAFFGAMAAPQTLNFVGWDWNRWNAISVVGGFACILAIGRYFPASKSPRISVVPMLTAGMVACLLSIAADYQLFDAFRVQFYPFIDQLNFIRRLLDPDFKYVPPS